MNELTKGLIILTGVLACLLLLGGVFGDVFLGLETYLENKYNMSYNITSGYCSSWGSSYSDINPDDPRCQQLSQWSLGWSLIGIVALVIYGSIALVGLGALNFLLEYLHYQKTRKLRFLKWNILFLVMGLVPSGIFWMILTVFN